MGIAEVNKLFEGSGFILDKLYGNENNCTINF
jgi:hypothetical protein